MRGDSVQHAKRVQPSCNGPRLPSLRLSLPHLPLSLELRHCFSDCSVHYSLDRCRESLSRPPELPPQRRVLPPDVEKLPLQLLLLPEEAPVARAQSAVLHLEHAVRTPAGPQARAVRCAPFPELWRAGGQALHPTARGARATCSCGGGRVVRMGGRRREGLRRGASELRLRIPPLRVLLHPRRQTRELEAPYSGESQPVPAAYVSPSRGGGVRSGVGGEWRLSRALRSFRASRNDSHGGKATKRHETDQKRQGNHFLQISPKNFFFMFFAQYRHA